MNTRVYLDYAAATPLDSEVQKAMHLAEANFANPSAQYSSAREAKKLLNDSRKQIAMFLNANAEEIILTSGATEANNLAILGSARAIGKGQIISIGTEHASVIQPLKQLEREGYKITQCKIGLDGMLSKSDFEKCLSKDTILVSISYANSEIGTIQPITKIAKIIREFENQNNIKIIFHTDASAAALTLNCDVSRLGVDMLTISSNKIYGPKGIGALYVKRSTKLQPNIFGGNQESGLRSGSESLPLAVGFAKALEITKYKSANDEKRFGELYSTLICELSPEGEQQSFIQTGSINQRLYNIASLIFEEINGEDLVAYLDSQGYEVSTGAACEASNDLPSQTILSLGYSKTQAQGSLRVSFGRNTSKDEVIEFTNALQETLSLLKVPK